MRFDPTNLRAALMAAAIDGYYIADIEDWPLKVARSQTDRLQKAGVLFAAHHGTMVGRTAKYFDTAEKAQAFVASKKAVKETKAYKTPNMRQIVITKPRVHAWWPADAKPVITSKTVVTICPSPGRALRTNTFAE